MLENLVVLEMLERLDFLVILVFLVLLDFLVLLEPLVIELSDTKLGSLVSLKREQTIRVFAGIECYRHIVFASATILFSFPW